jgi:hypothetical protein
MKWIMSQDKTCLIAPESGVTIAIHSFERTGSPTLHGTYYSLVAQSISAIDGARDVILGTYTEKKDAQQELERIFKSENPVVVM